MGNAATTKKGDSTESGEYLAANALCWGEYNFSFVRQALPLFL